MENKKTKEAKRYSFLVIALIPVTDYQFLPAAATAILDIAWGGGKFVAVGYNMSALMEL